MSLAFMPRSNKTRNKPKKGGRARRRRPRESRRTKCNPRGPSKQPGIGRSIGSALGNFAERGIRSLFGSGDYSVEARTAGYETAANSMIEPVTAEQVPLFSESSKHHGAVTVRHREYIQDLFSGTSVLPTAQEFIITPTNVDTFPWLSTIAQNFEQWIPLGIVFEFVSTAGSAINGTSAALGDVNFATQYNSAAPLFLNKSQLLNHFYSSSAATNANLMHAVECAPDDTPIMPRYLDRDNFVIPTDPRLDALGVFQYIGTGSPAAYFCGQLWITYEIVLLKPRLSLPAPPPRFTGQQVVWIAKQAEDAGQPLTFAEKVQLSLMASTSEAHEQKEAMAILTALELLDHPVLAPGGVNTLPLGDVAVPPLRKPLKVEPSDVARGWMG